VQQNQFEQMKFVIGRTRRFRLEVGFNGFILVFDGEHFLNSARTASGETPSRSAVFCA
jgi:hypothetical protein